MKKRRRRRNRSSQIQILFLIQDYYLTMKKLIIKPGLQILYSMLEFC